MQSHHFDSMLHLSFNRKFQMNAAPSTFLDNYIALVVCRASVFVVHYEHSSLACQVGQSDHTVDVPMSRARKSVR